jgi:hypothetical protein
MTPEQLHIIQHSLGCNKYGQNEAGGGGYYRDYYCVGLDNEKTLTDLRFLVSQGWMREGHKLNKGRDQYFHVTQLGISAMLGASPRPPKLTRDQKRYRDYLRADCGYSFIEYLKYLHHCKREGRIASY